MTPITKEALHGLFLFMPSELPVCYSYLAGKQHQLAHSICCVLDREEYLVASASVKCPDSKAGGGYDDLGTQQK